MTCHCLIYKVFEDAFERLRLYPIIGEVRIFILHLTCTNITWEEKNMNVKLRRFKSILSILLTVVMTAVFVLPSALAEEFTATANGWIYADADGGTANKVIVKFNRLIVFDETAWVDNITVNHADDTPGNFGTEAEACVNEDQQTIVITLGADNDIVIGDQITFAGTTVQDANQTEAFAGTVELGGSFEKAAVDFAVLPEDAVITVEGYEAPYELAIGA